MYFTFYMQVAIYWNHSRIGKVLHQLKNEVTVQLTWILCYIQYIYKQNEKILVIKYGKNLSICIFIKPMFLTPNKTGRLY